MNGICESCKGDMRVVNSKNKIVTNKNGDVELFVVLTMRCKNPNCAQYAKEVEVWNKQKID
ncbi:MAG: hypothetical protein RR459_07865 [Christensenellaceae bacterium]